MTYLFDLILELPNKLVSSAQDFLVKLCYSIAHPYSQISRVDGGSRINNLNWIEKFPQDVYPELFRFRKADMELLATALDV